MGIVYSPLTISRFMAKIQPSVEKMYFQIPNTNEPGVARNWYIDISQSTSIVNRRFQARQGFAWAVSNFEVFTEPNVTGSIELQKIPTNWVSYSAWVKVYHAWKRQQDEAIRDSHSESAVAKFRDFKIYADVDHVTINPAGTFDANLTPVDANGDPFLLGEWQPSQIVFPNVLPDASGSDVEPQENLLHMVGVNNNAGVSRGIIDGYGASRAFPQSPDPVSPVIGGTDNFLARMQNVGNDAPEVLGNATDRNDDLPYDQDAYPGGEVNAPTLQKVDSWETPATSITNEQRLDGGVFPCGLVKIISSMTSPGGSPDSPATICLTLVPGANRGYLNESMQDVN